MAVAAAELPELSRMGAQGRVAIRERLVSGMERIKFYVAPTVALSIAAGDVIVGALLPRGQFEAPDSRLVWLVLTSFAPVLLGTTSSRLTTVSRRVGNGGSSQCVTR